LWRPPRPPGHRRPAPERQRRTTSTRARRLPQPPFGLDCDRHHWTGAPSASVSARTDRWTDATNADVAPGPGNHATCNQCQLTPDTQFRIEKIVKARPLHSRATRMPTWGNRATEPDRPARPSTLFRRPRFSTPNSYPSRLSTRITRRCISYGTGLSAAWVCGWGVILPSWSCEFDSRHPLSMLRGSSAS
jgi:hypothetical protein